jgi:hypothetical protein
MKKILLTAVFSLSAAAGSVFSQGNVLWKPESSYVLLNGVYDFKNGAFGFQLGSSMHWPKNTFFNLFSDSLLDYTRYSHNGAANNELLADGLFGINLFGIVSPFIGGGIGIGWNSDVDEGLNFMWKIGAGTALTLGPVLLNAVYSYNGYTDATLFVGAGYRLSLGSKRSNSGAEQETSGAVVPISTVKIEDYRTMAGWNKTFDECKKLYPKAFLCRWAKSSDTPDFRFYRDDYVYSERGGYFSEVDYKNGIMRSSSFSPKIGTPPGSKDEGTWGLWEVAYRIGKDKHDIKDILAQLEKWYGPLKYTDLKWADSWAKTMPDGVDIYLLNAHHKNNTTYLLQFRDYDRVMGKNATR